MGLKAEREVDKHISRANEYLTEATEIALVEVERMARQILKRHKHLTEFVMCMGTWFFCHKNGNNLNFLYDRLGYLEPLHKFIFKYDEELHLTGCPMRFTATGEVITNW